MIDDETILAPQWELLADLGNELLCPDELYVTCPGELLHTTLTLPSHCKAYVNQCGRYQVIYLHCFHSSCRGIRAEVNDALYRIATKGESPSFLTRDSGSSQMTGLKRKEPSEQFPQLLGTVLTRCPWTYSEIANHPLYRVEEDPVVHPALVLSLFDRDDRVWVGRNVRDSGKPGHKWRFRTPEEWVDRCWDLGPYISPNPFKPGSISRCEHAVRTRKFLVVESDVLTHDETGAVFRFLNETVCRLRAVVDTANRSLHAWYDYPHHLDEANLRELLIGLKCDPSMLNPSQPCRMPGMLRDGKYQRLIYFDHPEYNSVPPSIS